MPHGCGGHIDGNNEHDGTNDRRGYTNNGGKKGSNYNGFVTEITVCIRSITFHNTLLASTETNGSCRQHSFPKSQLEFITFDLLSGSCI